MCISRRGVSNSRSLVNFNQGSGFENVTGLQEQALSMTFQGMADVASCNL